MSYPTVINGLDFRDLIFVADNDTVTDSFMVVVSNKNEVTEIKSVNNCWV